jgi:hypothetical protein
MGRREDDDEVSVVAGGRDFLVEEDDGGEEVLLALTRTMRLNVDVDSAVSGRGPRLLQTGRSVVDGTRADGLIRLQNIFCGYRLGPGDGVASCAKRNVEVWPLRRGREAVLSDVLQNDEKGVNLQTFAADLLAADAKIAENSTLNRSRLTSESLLVSRKIDEKV